MQKTTDAVTTAIRVEMTRHRLTQRDLATALGVTQATVSSRMNGHTDWSLGELRVIAEALGMSLVDLLADAA